MESTHPVDTIHPPFSTTLVPAINMPTICAAPLGIEHIHGFNIRGVVYQVCSKYYKADVILTMRDVGNWALAMVLLNKKNNETVVDKVIT